MILWRAENAQCLGRAEASRTLLHARYTPLYFTGSSAPSTSLLHKEHYGVCGEQRGSRLAWPLSKGLTCNVVLGLRVPSRWASFSRVHLPTSLFKTSCVSLLKIVEDAGGDELFTSTPPWRIWLKARVDLGTCKVISTTILAYFNVFLGINSRSLICAINTHF